MILDHTEPLGLRLLEADDFRRFRLRLSGARRNPALAGVTFLADGDALIDAALPPTLPGAPQSEDWRAGYRDMIAYAATKGWLEGDAVRAHVERIA
jgi:hypothetical protein